MVGRPRKVATPRARAAAAGLFHVRDGSRYFTGTGFPKDFMIKYHMYRIYFPLLALGRYRRKTLGA